MNRTLSIRVTWGRIMALLAIAGVVWGIFLYRSVMGVFQDAYALWNVGDVVVYHLARTGEWPRSWDDLRIDFAEAKRDVDGSKLAHCRALIEIDFYADARRLKESPAWKYPQPPSFRVIRNVSGRGGQFEDPNEMVWNYLNGVGQPATLPATTQPLR